MDRCGRTDYELNDDGYVTKLTLPALGDGTRLVSEFQYDDRHNLEEILSHDVTTESWTYASDYTRVLSYPDENGRLTTFDHHMGDQHGEGAAKQVIISRYKYARLRSP